VPTPPSADRFAALIGSIDLIRVKPSTVMPAKTFDRDASKTVDRDG